MMVNLPCLMESCSNFLRPTCSYTECRLSFLTGSCPTERTPVSYSSCFYLILTGLPSPMEICWYSGRFFPCSDLLVLLLMQCFDHSIVIGLLSRTLPESGLAESRQGSGIIILSLLLCYLCHLLYRSFYVWQKLLRIICHSLCQYRINYPQQLAGDHYQWLHLFQWIITSRCIVGM